MSFDAETYYKIEAYLNGELNQADVTAFEQELSANAALKAEVEKHAMANALIVEQRLLSVKNILQEEKTKDSRSIKKYLLLALAAVIISVGVAVFIRSSNISETKQREAGDTANPAQINGQEKNAVTPVTSLERTEQHTAVSSDNGFHKQSIQQIEQQRNLLERTVHTVDTATSAVPEKKIAQPVDSKEKEIIQHTTKADPCANVKIQALIKTTPTCAHTANGNILVQNIQGGTKPYTVTFSAKSTDWIRNGELAKGTYQAVVTDANNCVQEFSNIRIEEKECAIDYSFNPFIGEKWQIDKYHSDGHLEIFNKGGVLYYQTTIESQTEAEWNGSGSGNQILPGYYIFVLKYSDGTVKRGSVTIVQ
ncbi:gliding motility-associated C-terminal domain-containing protein [Cytophaga hutchinsonii]|uniref:Uncharacterized protein n=1 Tax=Cytophaga hutchinsonii (strain ATCC 33406 / DSM 1761 / CIP 103989 / NBRC 15051 / NCIMB 9469 / D465) TaxID=269798 RepID=A0A6N4SP94_CYTH3|nr:gliding motility-associated C-terminal domain-containing protein [Cytophaga hutchinsonii]ABG58068.1 hypothetical protein CHU_0781 [Cytophaga hutchinsonii ATCC 33406]SFX12804.1 C-terminal domain of CHU protein family protein [Cytophaga hutchinsonii ATCC 33406]